MLSKLLPWDFVQKYPQTLDLKQKGLVAFYVENPFMERILLNRIPKEENSFRIYSGNEITIDFLEEQFVNLSFFSSTENIQVLNAELIPAHVLTYIIENELEVSDRYFVLFFTKTNKNILELFKQKNINAFEVESPRFWEGAKLLNFCMKVKGINLPSNVVSFLLDSLEHNFESFIWALDLIELNFANGAVTPNDLAAFISKERWDFFELIDTFNHGQKNFFNEILKHDHHDYEWYRSLFAFMQGYLVKVLSPEEILSKSKPNKFEQTILGANKQWKPVELKKYIRLFSELEIMAKSSDSLLINKLRMMIL